MVTLKSLAQWGTFLSGVASLVLLLFVAYQAMQTQESLQITRDEISKRLRPWIGRQDFVEAGITLNNGIRQVKPTS